MLMVLSLLILAAGCTDKVTNPRPAQYFVFSFETTQGGPLEGWVTYTADIDNQHWSITRTLDRAKDGISSAKFSLDDVGGKGKIWIQRIFPVDTSADYHVTVGYQFATSDFGTTGFWRIITGARPYLVESAGELIYQDDTRNWSNTNVGHLWIGKSYQFDVQSNSRGQIYVQIGIRGDGEGFRTYYLDSVYLAFSKK